MRSIITITIIYLLSFIHTQAQCWQQVAAGATHTVAVKTDGTLWAWGSNGAGQFGNGTNISKKIPIQVGTATDWQQAAAGHIFSIFMKNDGSLWSSGLNANGALGTGNNLSTNIPVKITCPVSSINYISLTDNTLLFPNPVKNALNIQSTDIDPTSLVFEISNVLGKVIFPRQSLIDNQPINVEQLAPGIYLLILYSKEGQTARQFVKM